MTRIVDEKAQEVIFWRKANKIVHPPLYFNNATVKFFPTQKLCGLQPDIRLSLKNILTIKLVNQQKVSCFFVSCNVFYHAEAN